MFEPTTFALVDEANATLTSAEATEGEMEIADIRYLLALKYELDRMSKRIDDALMREVPA